MNEIFKKMWDFIAEWATDLGKSLTEFLLKAQFNFFNDIMKMSISQFTKDIASFSEGALNVVRDYSTKVAIPLAILILVFVFVQELYNLQVEQNNAVSLEEQVQKGALILLRFCATLFLTKNSIDVLLYLFNIVQNLLLRVNENVAIIANTVDLSKDIANSSSGNEILMILLIVFIMFFVIIGSALIILGVAYSRMIMIYMLLCFSPIAFATFVSKNSWLSSVWQNFAKNIFALSLQGLIISLIIRIIGGLFTSMSIQNNALGILSLGVIMVVGAVSIVKSLSFGKTILGLN